MKHQSRIATTLAATLLTAQAALAGTITFDDFDAGGSFAFASSNSYVPVGVVFSRDIPVLNLSLVDPTFRTNFIAGGCTLPNAMALGTNFNAGLDIDLAFVVPGTTISTNISYFRALFGDGNVGTVLGTLQAFDTNGNLIAMVTSNTPPSEAAELVLIVPGIARVRISTDADGSVIDNIFFSTRTNVASIDFDDVTTAGFAFASSNHYESVGAVFSRDIPILDLRDPRVDASFRTNFIAGGCTLPNAMALGTNFNAGLDIDLAFVVPGTTIPANINYFRALFGDGNVATVLGTLQAFDASGNSIAMVTSNTPPSEAAELVLSVPGIARVRISTDADGSVIDNIFFSTPTAPVGGLSGRIVVANDDWPLGNVGFHDPCDPGTFARNVGAWFTGGKPGKFLVYSDHLGLTGSSLSNAMAGAGHTWIVNASSPFDLATLQDYDGVFVGMTTPVDTLVLVDYVSGGGHVYLAAACNANDPARLNPFLESFGLHLDTVGTGSGDIPIASSHPLFAGVDYLYQDGGFSIVDL